MTQIIAYLTFNGNCRAAMEFYRQCLGGELTLQTIGEMPGACSLPREIRACVLQATLTHDSFVLMGTDLVEENGLSRGNAVALMLKCTKESDIQALFGRLSDGGTAVHPLKSTYWGGLHGALTDRFGTQWMLHYTPGK